MTDLNSTGPLETKAADADLNDAFGRYNAQWLSNWIRP
jgi:hypothetical protein